MSTSTAAIRTGSGRLRPAPVEVVLARRIFGEMWRITRWFWPIASLVTVGIGFTISRYTPITSSIWENAGQWPRWWLFSMAIALVSTQLPLVVMHGVTRRTGLRALGLAAVAVSLFWAAFMVAGHVIERFVYGRLGWPDALESPHLFGDGYDVLPMLAEFFLIFLAYQVSGALIGALYYRFGVVPGTLLIPLGLLPAVAMELLLSTSWVGGYLQDTLSLARPPAFVLVIASVAVLAPAGGAVRLVLRDVPIHGKK
jgi:hypothetical protein